MNVQILPMAAADVPQVAELEKACFSDPWPESVLSNELENELSLWLVAKDKDTVLGYIGSQSVLDEALQSIPDTAPANRGSRGTG